MRCGRWNSLTPLSKAAAVVVVFAVALGIAVALYGRYAPIY